MTTHHTSLDASGWDALQAHARRLDKIPVRDLFAADPERFERYSRQFEGILLDFSRQRLDDAALAALLDLAGHVGLRTRISALLDGALVNDSERRAALHTLLRVPAATPVTGPLAPLHTEVLAVRARLAAFVREIHDGTAHGRQRRALYRCHQYRHRWQRPWPGDGGRSAAPIPHRPPALPLRLQRGRTAARRSRGGPRSGATLVIVCSKTFTTQETLANAHRARSWIAGRLGEAAVPAAFRRGIHQPRAMDEFGVGADARFAMWDWVGGRYSVWSAVGLALELAIGTRSFEAFLAGARQMDQHFRNAPWRDNLPVLLGLLAVWNRNGLGCASHAVLPYHQRLARFPAYLQQLEMESLGKRRDARRSAGHARTPAP